MNIIDVKPGEVIQPRLSRWVEMDLKDMREKDRYTRTPEFVIRDLFKLMYNRDYIIAPKEGTRWWAEILSGLGQIELLRNVTKGSYRWSMVGIEAILESLKEQKQQSPVLPQQRLERTRDQWKNILQKALQHASTVIAKQKQDGLQQEDGQSAGKSERRHVLVNKNTEWVLEHSQIGAETSRRIASIARKMLTHAMHVLGRKDYVPHGLLEAEEVQDLLSPEWLALRLPSEAMVLSEGRAMKFDVYIDFSGSTGDVFIPSETGSVNVLDMELHVANILYKNGLVAKTRVFDSFVYSNYIACENNTKTERPIRQPRDLFGLDPGGGTSFNGVLGMAGNRPSIVISDGCDDVDTLIHPYRDTILWIIVGTHFKNGVPLSPWIVPYLQNRQVVSLTQSGECQIVSLSQLVRAELQCNQSNREYISNILLEGGLSDAAVSQLLGTP